MSPSTSSSPPPSTPPAAARRPLAAAAAPAAAAAALAQAARALWLATLSLMTAFMHTQAPAHRLLLARRIACNFTTLAGQPCFAASDRDRFARLARRWQDKADRLAPQGGRPESAARPWLARLPAWWSRAWRGS